MKATVFGGTGFLGQRIAARLAAEGAHVRVAARRPSRWPFPKGLEGMLEPVTADVTDPDSIAAAVAGADAVVNSVSLYVPTRRHSFADIHVRGAGDVAAAASAAGVRVLVQISGIGADPASASTYVSARAEGEEAVRAAFADAAILRPSVMFGRGDSFLSGLGRIVASLPVVPLFGRGGTRLQPVLADDVAQAVARVIGRDDACGRTFELGGPEIVTYRALLERVMQWTGRRRLLVPLPFAVWWVLAATLSVLRSPPLTVDQVVLMEKDNIADPDRPGFDELGIAPARMDDVAAAIFRAAR